MEGIGNPGTCHGLVKVELHGGVEGVLGHVQDEQHGAVLHLSAFDIKILRVTFTLFCQLSDNKCLLF